MVGEGMMMILILRKEGSVTFCSWLIEIVFVICRCLWNWKENNCTSGVTESANIFFGV